MGGFTTLSLDLGSTLGWALGKNGVIESSGEVALSAKDSHPGHRWMRFQEWLAKFHDVDEILYEEVQAFRSSQASMVYGALRAVLQMYALAYKIRLCTLTPGQIKMDFTGNGNAPKELMCDIAMNLGWTKGRRGSRDYNNECDAIALLWVIFSRRGIQPSFQTKGAVA